MVVVLSTRVALVSAVEGGGNPNYIIQEASIQYARTGGRGRAVAVPLQTVVETDVGARDDDGDDDMSDSPGETEGEAEVADGRAAGDSVEDEAEEVSWPEGWTRRDADGMYVPPQWLAEWGATPQGDLQRAWRLTRQLTRINATGGPGFREAGPRRRGAC